MNPNKAIVAAGHSLVCSTAMEIMEAGGNCFDAAVVAGLTGALVEPGLTSLGGGGFLLAHSNDRQPVLYDFFSNTPGLGLPSQELTPHFFPITVNFPSCDQDFNVGMGSVAVPGNLKGYLHIHDQRGRLPFSEIVKPVIRLAREGVVLRKGPAYVLQLLRPIMTMTAEGRKLYAPQGNYLREGDRFHNDDYADFLEQLVDDEEQSFYRGALAGRIAEDMQQGQGLLTLQDLTKYRVIERNPLEARYRDLRFLTNPAPSFGGSLIALTLQLLEQHDLSSLQWGGEEHLKELTQTLIRVDELRRGGVTYDPEMETIALTDELRTFTRGTTHVSIIDHEGNVASMTTSNGEGSGYIVPGTGIMLNNMMGEDDLHPDGFHACPPGKRVASMMSPSVVLDRESSVRLVIGSGGSKRIRTAIVQVLSNIFDFQLPIDQAIKAPRIHWDGDLLQVEPGYDSTALSALERAVKVNPWAAPDIYFGGVHALIPGEGGAGDPRRGGAVIQR